MFTDDDAAKAAAVFFGHEMPGSAVAFREALNVFAPLVVLRSVEACAAKAREYAAHYPQGSDGRNTFVLLAEWIENRAAAHSN